MKQLMVIALTAMVLVVPLAGMGAEPAGAANPGMMQDNLGRKLVAASWNDAPASPDLGHALRGHVAAVTLFSSDSDLNKVVGTPIWGVDGGFVYWFFPQLGVGLSGQFFSASGNGEVDGVHLTDTNFTYLNVLVNFYSRFVAWNKVSLYGMAGLGYSKARLEGTGTQYSVSMDFDETDEGMAYQVGIGLDAPWVFTELRYSESSYSQGQNEEGKNVVAVLDSFQIVLGVRTP